MGLSFKFHNVNIAGFMHWSVVVSKHGNNKSPGAETGQSSFANGEHILFRFSLSIDVASDDKLGLCVHLLVVVSNVQAGTWLHLSSYFKRGQYVVAIKEDRASSYMLLVVESVAFVLVVPKHTFLRSSIFVSSGPPKLEGK